MGVWLHVWVWLMILVLCSGDGVVPVVVRCCSVLMGLLVGVLLGRVLGRSAMGSVLGVGVEGSCRAVPVQLVAGQERHNQGIGTAGMTYECVQGKVSNYMRG